MKKTNELSNFFGLVDLLKDFDYEKLYNKLIYGSEIVYENDNFLSLVFDKINCENKRIEEDKILIGNALDNNDVLMNINFLINLDNLDSVLIALLEYLKKKKLLYTMIIVERNNLCDITINMSDKDYLTKVVDFINDKLGKKIESLNPLVFKDDKVGLSFHMEYTYNDILVMYLFEFLKNEKCLNYIGFKKIILDNYFNITNQVNMYKFIKYNTKKIKLSEFFRNIEIMTSLLINVINEKDVEDYIDYYKKLKKEKKKNINLYLDYDNLDVNNDLFKELVICMYEKYGLEYCKNSIVNYRNSGKKIYITRANDLRKRITESKTFMIFLQGIDFDLEFDKIVSSLCMDDKVKILEDICKETYLTCNDLEKANSGKIQIARMLIRITCGDYSSVTRNNNARQIAIENINPNDVVQLIKKTLKIDYVKKESTLYELYADYIVNLCL